MSQLSPLPIDKTWTRRDALFTLFHAWVWLLGCFAIGALAGYGLAYVWPSTQRAAQVVYVGLNPYRAYSDSGFLALSKPKYINLDNYHYWQMSQLNTFILSDRVLQDTLDGLRHDDPAWQTATLDDLRSSLSSEWRTAGEWELSAVDAQPQRARQLIDAWSESAAGQVQQAVESAQRLIQVDQERTAAVDQLAQARGRLALLTAAPARSQAWQTQLAALPSGDPLPVDLRWQMAGLALNLADGSPAWSALLAGQPQADATAAQASAWLGGVVAQASLDAALLPTHIASLEQQQQQLQLAYAQTQENSAGLSPNISIQRIGQPSVDNLRPTAMMALVGAIIGLLVGLIVMLARLRRAPLPEVQG